MDLCDCPRGVGCGLEEEEEEEVRLAGGVVGDREPELKLMCSFLVVRAGLGEVCGEFSNTSSSSSSSILCEGKKRTLDRLARCSKVMFSGSDPLLMLGCNIFFFLL